MSDGDDRRGESGREPGPGHYAERPTTMPTGAWLRILGRVWTRALQENLSLIAAGVGFYGLLALFPAIAALVTTYGLLFDPGEIQTQFDTLEAVLPAEVHRLISQQMTSVASGSGQSLGLGLAGAIVLSLWGATRGTKALIVALNLAYDEREERGLLGLNLLAFALTLVMILVLSAAAVVTVLTPIALGFVGLQSLAATLVAWLRWPLLAAVALLALAILYRFGPCRRAPRWRWLPVGSILAGLLWLGASGLFSFYVSSFGSYNATYGSLGAVIILLVWLYLTALSVILGAGLNAEAERQTARDTTIGEARPKGERGAYVADHLPG